MKRLHMLEAIALANLREKPMHAYDLAKASDIKTSSIYNLLDQMYSKELVKIHWDQSIKRKIYSISPVGLEALTNTKDLLK